MLMLVLLAGIARAAEPEAAPGVGPASVPAAASALAPVPLAIEPSRFEFVGSTILDATAQAELLAPFRGRPLATADLLDLVEAVRTRYAEAGYGAAEVELPDQDLAGGRVELRIHEGSVEAIEVRGAVTRWPAYYRAFLARATGSPLHVPTLYRALERLQAEPGVAKISAVLERIGPGRQRLFLEVEERSPWSATARFSNHRSPSVGSPGGLFSLATPSLTGFGDRLALQGQVSEGIRDFGLRWDVPLVVGSTRAFVAYRRGDAEIVEGDFEGAGIAGRFESIAVGLHQPVYWSPGLEAALELVGDWRRGGSQLLGVDYCFQASLIDCEPTVSVLRMSQELLHRGRSRAAALRSTLSVGLDVLGATEERRTSDRDGEFVSWLLQLQWVERLPRLEQLPLLDDVQLVGRFDLQLADDPLVAVEQFAVGGGTSVRGYRENQLVRDNGFAASAELRIPVLRSRFGEPVTTLAPFFDVGRGWDRRRTSSPDKTLPSLGVALRHSITRSLRAEISWAHRFRNAEPKAGGLQGQGVYFEVVWDVF
ncbi:BamA/TamA family outer membrane protein [Myxococcota bacterium]|nr:BamA/TamA family outer membrane protein [Myxococcota bacterium]